MMRLGVVAVVGAMLCGGEVFALEQDLLAQLGQRVAHSHSEHKLCRKFRKKWTSVVKGGLNSESPSHTSKDHALDTIVLLEKFPDLGLGTRRAFGFVAENREALAKLSDQKAVLDQVSAIRSECEIFSRTTHLSLLLKDIDAFGFPQKDRRRVKSLAKRYFAAGGFSPTSVPLRGNVLRAYLEHAYEGENKEQLLGKARAILEEYETKQKKIAQESKLADRATKQGTFEFLLPEFMVAEEAVRAQQELVNEAGL